jgi:hypothetical protein
MRKEDVAEEEKEGSKEAAPSYRVAGLALRDIGREPHPNGCSVRTWRWSAVEERDGGFR